LYGYRVKNIVDSELIVQEKLVKAKEGWKDFISLVGRLGMKIPGAGN
jgi:hypothetical protein